MAEIRYSIPCLIYRCPPKLRPSSRCSAAVHTPPQILLVTRVDDTEATGGLDNYIGHIRHCLGGNQAHARDEAQGGSGRATACQQWHHSTFSGGRASSGKHNARERAFEAPPTEGTRAAHVMGAGSTSVSEALQRFEKWLSSWAGNLYATGIHRISEALSHEAPNLRHPVADVFCTVCLGVRFGLGGITRGNYHLYTLPGRLHREDGFHGCSEVGVYRALSRRHIVQ